MQEFQQDNQEMCGGVPHPNQTYPTTVSETGHMVCLIRFDSAQEFQSKEFNAFCEANGIRLEYIVPYIHQQNGITEHAIGKIPRSKEFDAFCEANGIRLEYIVPYIHQQTASQNVLSVRLQRYILGCYSTQIYQTGPGHGLGNTQHMFSTSGLIVGSRIKHRTKCISMTHHLFDI